MIEINTDICESVEEISQDIKQTLDHLEEILKDYNASINCSSLHSFAKGKNQIISNDSRYKRIMKDLQNNRNTFYYTRSTRAYRH